MPRASFIDPAELREREYRRFAYAFDCARAVSFAQLAAGCECGSCAGCVAVERRWYRACEPENVAAAARRLVGRRAEA